MSDIAVTRGAHHIGLTVPDLARTRAFFLDTLGFVQVGEVPDYPALMIRASSSDTARVTDGGDMLRRRAAGAKPASSATPTNTVMVRNRSMIIPDIRIISCRLCLFCPETEVPKLHDMETSRAYADHQGRERPSNRGGQLCQTLPLPEVPITSD